MVHYHRSLPDRKLIRKLQQDLQTSQDELSEAKRELGLVRKQFAMSEAECEECTGTVQRFAQEADRLRVERDEVCKSVKGLRRILGLE